MGADLWIPAFAGMTGVQRIGGIFGYGERGGLEESEILKILILTKGVAWEQTSGFPLSRE